MPCDRIRIAPYDSGWPAIYEKERERILSRCGSEILEIEHIGSTAVPHQKAKPVIDIMVATASLRQSGTLVKHLQNLDYQLIPTDMPDRIFLQKKGARTIQFFHLHLVEISSWDNRKERVMRDYLCAHPDAVADYSLLKEHLAAQYPDDIPGYTKAKTDFIQNLMNKAYDELGRRRIDVWKDA